MALFKQTQSKLTSEESVPKSDFGLPASPPTSIDGMRDFWQHWDYVLSLVPELSEFGVPVLDSVGLTLNESIVTESDLADDVKAGDAVVAQGTRIIPRMLGLLAGMGITKVMARPNPRVLVMALSQQAVPASFLVAAQAQEAGAVAHRLEFIYSAVNLTVSGIIEQLVRADLVVTVGGLGESRVDLREAADRIGPHDFTPIAITPGGDHGFALAEGRIPLLAVPANAHAAFVLTKLLIEPMIAKLMGAGGDPELFSAFLAQPLKVKPRILTCVPALVKGSSLKIVGLPSGLPGLYSIYQANALAILTSEDGLVKDGSQAFYLPLR